MHLGVAPGQYSLNELARIKAAQDAGEPDQVDALKALFDGSGASSQSNSLNGTVSVTVVQRLWWGWRHLR